MHKSKSSNFHSKTNLGREVEPKLPNDLLIDLHDLEYSIERPIGQGAFGSVYKARLKSRNKEVALKIYHLDIVNSNSSKRLLQNVVKELTSLDHENIIKCFGLCLEKMGIVLELAEKTIMLDSQPVTVHSLRQLINVVGDDGEIPDWLILDAMFQITKGLEYLHNSKVNHGDLKSANVLVSGKVDTEYSFILADFGQPQSAITSLQGIFY